MEPSTGRPDPQVSSLLEIEALLRRPDFVMEPKCWDTILKYITAGGKPQNLIECLADSYVGYAQMASLVCKWLKLVEDSPMEEADGATGQSTQAGMSHAHTTASGGQPLDEFHFLKEFTRQRFDPTQLSGIFTQGGGKPPSWLEGLTSEPRGRQLIYQLSAAHKNCLLLNFAIQKILMQGHEDEVASVGSSLASYFSVFHRLLATRLKAVASHCVDSPDGSSAAQTADPSLEVLARELVHSCSQSQHTYLHAQQLLLHLGGHPKGGAVFRRLSQQLEGSAAEGEAPAAVWNSTRMFVPSDASASTVESYNLVCRMLLSAPALNPADIVSLAALYNSSTPPLVAPLHHPRLLQSLLFMIFTGNAKASGMNKEAQMAAIDLLSRSTTTSDEDARMERPGGISSGGPDAARFAATKEALNAALSLGAQAQQGKMTADGARAAYQVVSCPVASLGLLQTMRSHLSLREYYHEASASTAAPAYIRLATAITIHQPDLVHEVLQLFEVTLAALGSQRAEFSRLVLDATVTLMRDCHAVEPCMAMVDRWATEADPSLVRYFIFQVLSSLHTPYSAVFARWLLHHMIASGVRRGRDGHRGSRNAALLQNYAKAWAEMDLYSQLEAKEIAFLQEVAK